MMDLNIHIGLPQGIYLLMLFGEIINSGRLHGKKREPLNGFVHMTSWLLITALVLWGGFFG